MQANVYVLVEHRDTSTDIYMLGGTQQELLDYYAELKGGPARNVQQVVKDGFEHLIFDEDDAGQSMIAQYRVGIQEVIEP
jgi:hypothetical protein